MKHYQASREQSQTPSERGFDSLQASASLRKWTTVAAIGMTLLSGVEARANQGALWTVQHSPSNQDFHDATSSRISTCREMIGQLRALAPAAIQNLPASALGRATDSVNHSIADLEHDLRALEKSNGNLASRIGTWRANSLIERTADLYEDLLVTQNWQRILGIAYNRSDAINNRITGTIADRNYNTAYAKIQSGEIVGVSKCLLEIREAHLVGLWPGLGAGALALAGGYYLGRRSVKR